MTKSRFALYLVAPYPVAREVGEIHSLLRKQFGLVAADNFQAHCTIKGFFKMVDRPWEPLLTELDSLFADQPPFEVEFSGFQVGSKSIVMDISKCGEVLNSTLLNIRDQIVNLIRPYIAPDCDFVASDLGSPFRGHITLAFNDIPLGFKNHVLNYLDKAPIPSGSFQADTFHFLSFLVTTGMDLGGKR